MAIPGWAIEKALYTRLTTHADTSGYTVVGGGGTSSTFPYIKLGATLTNEQKRNKSNDGADTVPQIDIWGDPQDGDSDMCGAIAANVHSALTSAVLDITGDGYVCLNTPVDAMYVEYEEYDASIDRTLRHGVFRPRYMVMKS